MLVGYGLVVGLNNTGDSLQNAPFTKQAIQSMMERLGVNTHDPTATGLINTKNVAAVMVTARLPPFAAPGSQIDVTVSAMGDAKSLLGGTLLVTAADGRRRPDLRGRARHGGDRRGLGLRRVRLLDHPRRADRRPHRRRGASSSARSASTWTR